MRKGQSCPPEVRARISASLVAFNLGEMAARGEEPGHKFCSRCESTKLTDEFYSRRHKCKSGLITVRPEAHCKECVRARQKAHRQEAKAADHKGFREQMALYERRHRKRHPEAHRQYHREWRRAKRLAEGKEPGAAWSKYRAALAAKQPRVMLSAAPLVEFLGDISLPHLPDSLQRSLYAIRHGERKRLELHLVDALLHHAGRPDALHELYPPKESSRPTGYQILDPDGVLKSAAA